MNKPAAGSVPLSPQVFQVLLSLVDGASHGYAIIQDVEARTDREMRLTPSTLYDALARLVDQRLIEELDDAPDGAAASSRRRYYRLTAAGRAAAETEARRLEKLIAMARDKRLLRRPSQRGPR
jgi:DNA-binding PadR family transcriptional regulator